jgi:hypothetical protein
MTAPGVPLGPRWLFIANHNGPRPHHPPSHEATSHVRILASEGFRNRTVRDSKHEKRSVGRIPNRTGEP